MNAYAEVLLAESVQTCMWECLLCNLLQVDLSLFDRDIKLLLLVQDASVSGDSDAEASAGMGDDGDKPASEDETSAQQDADSGASEGAASPAAGLCQSL